MKITFRSGRESDARTIAELAGRIWNQVYTGIISQRQIDFMLGRVYHSQLLRKELRNGPEAWILASQNHTLTGFASWGPGEAAKAKLHKLYLDPSWHGRGLGSQMLQMAEQQAAQAGYRDLYLQVNKKNAQAIRCYQQNGYRRIKEVVVPIGGGYVMDDFIYSKILIQKKAGSSP